MRPIHQRAGQREVGVGASEDDRRVLGDIDILQRAHEQGVAFAAAGRPAVERLTVRE